MSAVPITVYTREDCHLCEEAADAIERAAAAADAEVELHFRDVDDDPDLREAYGDKVPYVLVDGTPQFTYRVDESRLRSLLSG